MILVGYGFTCKGYLLLNPLKDKVIESSYVQFEENLETYSNDKFSIGKTSTLRLTLEDDLFEKEHRNSMEVVRCCSIN